MTFFFLLFFQVTVWGDYSRMEKKVFMGVAQIVLDDIDLAEGVINWYKLFHHSSLASSLAANDRNSSFLSLDSVGWRWNSELLPGFWIKTDKAEQQHGAKDGHGWPKTRPCCLSFRTDVLSSSRKSCIFRFPKEELFLLISCTRSRPLCLDVYFGLTLLSELSSFFRLSYFSIKTNHPKQAVYFYLIS